MDFGTQNLLLFVSLSLIPSVSSLICGGLICDGLSSYCCGFNNQDCCYESVYQFWWFWFIWVIFFAIISSCVFCCYRRRRYRNQYVIVRDNTAPAYGTVTTVTAPPAYPATQHQVPTAPPSYRANEKPPAYVP